MVKSSTKGNGSKAYNKAKGKKVPTPSSSDLETSKDELPRGDASSKLMGEGIRVKVVEQERVLRARPTKDAETTPKKGGSKKKSSGLVTKRLYPMIHMKNSKHQVTKNMKLRKHKGIVKLRNINPYGSRRTAPDPRFWSKNSKTFMRPCL